MMKDKVYQIIYKRHLYNDKSVSLEYRDTFDNLLKSYWNSLSIVDKHFYNNSLEEFMRIKYQKHFNIEVDDG